MFIRLHVIKGNIMKKNLLFFIFLLETFILYGQNFSLDGAYFFKEDFGIEGFSIKGNTICFEYGNEDLKDVIYEYKIEHFEGIPFFVISEKIPINLLSNNKEETNKILFLLGLRSNKYKVLFGYTKGYSIDGTPCTHTRFDELGATFYDCSSFLREKKKDYTINNLSSLAIETPWVEGVSGYGLGEKFSVKRDDENYLLIINGFISFDKPYLYKQNGRVKKLKIIGKQTGTEIICEVLDTPHPQTIDISNIIEKEDIQVMLEDVYTGSKYEDTCIQYLLPWDEEIIPFEDSIE